jgi:mitochondrial protein import protein ZIM17
MLPSRLFRNTGLPPALRSLITPRASLPPNIAVQLRLRLGVLQGSVNASAYSTSGPSTTPSSSSSSGSGSGSSSGSTTPTPTPPLSRAASFASHPSSSASTTSAGSPALIPATNANSQPLQETLEPKLSMTFTCTVTGCSHRSTHEFSKRAYERGIVLVECPGCKNR